MIFEEGRQMARNALLANNPDLSLEALDTPGGSAYGFTYACGIVYEFLAFKILERYANGFFLTAEGDRLSILAADHFDVNKEGATSAQATLEIERTGADISAALTIPAGTKVTTTVLNGPTFETLVSIAFAGGEAGPKSVVAMSLAAGVSQNAKENTLTKFADGPPDGEDGVTVTNPERAAGGNPEETDAEFRKLIAKVFFGNRRATIDAIRLGALTTPRVREAAVYEGLDLDGRQNGTVSAVIADSEGYSNSALELATTLELLEWRAAGVMVFPIGGTPIQTPIEVVIGWKAGQATAENAFTVQQTIIAFVNELDPNPTDDLDAIPDGVILEPGLVEHACRSVSGVAKVTVIQPVGAVIPGKGEMFRVGLGDVKVS